MMTQTNESLEMLVMVSRLLSSKLDISELLVTIMRLSSRVVGAERASLYLLDEKTQELYFDVALGLPEDIQKIRLKLGEGIAGICAKEGKSIISNNVQQDSRHSSKIDQESGYVTRSLLTCPMIVKGKVIGVVQAINKIEGEFDETDKNNFEAFASQAAIAIENSRLFNRVKEEKNKLDIVFKKMKEGAILSKIDGEIILMNSAARLYLEYDSHKVINVKELLSFFNYDVNLEDIINSQDNIYTFEVEREKPKKLILEISVIKILKETKQKSELEGLLWIISDITERKMEEKITRNFLSLVSHKLKTPLAAINGYAQILADEDKSNLPEPIKKAAASIYSQGNKLARLIDNLIDFTAIENISSTDLSISEFSVEEFLNEIFDEMKENYNDVVFKIAILDKFNLNADKRLLKKAIKEIIDNGIKFNKSEQKLIIITSQIKNDKKMISIGDNGVGIPPEEISKIFNKFYQIEASFTGQVEGWGLGLAIAKKIIDLHKGKIVVKSQLDKGSAFTIIL